jgi:hypothetical protein
MRQFPAGFREVRARSVRLARGNGEQEFQPREKTADRVPRSISKLSRE